MDSAKIPKVIHQIWVGEKAPDWVVQCMEHVRWAHPEWQVVLWDNAAVERHLFPRDNELEGGWGRFEWAHLADRIRLWALKIRGGFFLDADSFLLRPLDCIYDEVKSAPLVACRRENGVLGTDVGFLAAQQDAPALDKLLEIQGIPSLGAKVAQAIAKMDTVHWLPEAVAYARTPTEDSIVLNYWRRLMSWSAAVAPGYVCLAQNKHNNVLTLASGTKLQCEKEAARVRLEGDHIRVAVTRPRWKQCN